MDTFLTNTKHNVFYKVGPYQDSYNHIVPIAIYTGDNPT